MNIMRPFYKYNKNSNYKMSNCLFQVSISLMIYLCLINGADSACLTQSPTIGCLSCVAGQTIVFNVSSSLYACSATVNCSKIENNTCLQCKNGAIYDQVNQNCVSSPGCVDYFNNTCVQCDTNYYLANNVCSLKSIRYCADYVTNSTSPVCSKCLYEFMDPLLNCSVNPDLCEIFDYSLMKCSKCPTNQSKTMYSNGQICYVIVQNCQFYDTKGNCLFCKINYIYDGLNCVLGQAKRIQEQILVYNLSSTQPVLYEHICIDNSFYYNNVSLNCQLNPNIIHCRQNTTTTNCSTCLPGYFVNNDQCEQCDLTISNCALCSSSLICTSCSYGYYVFKINSTLTKCMPCSSFNCLHCSTQFNLNGKVQCLSCPVNSTLYAGSCFKCQNTSFAYSIKQSKCRNCSLIVENCNYCKFNNDGTNQTIICLQCAMNFILNPVTSQCQPLENQTLTLSNSFQIMKKLAQQVQQILYNNKNALMSACNQTDGYVCICTVLTMNQTSLCTTFSNLTSTVNTSGVSFVNTADVAKYANQLRMVSQLPNFVSTSIPTITEQLTQFQFWNLISAYTNIINRNQIFTEKPTNDTLLILNKIQNISKLMSTAFSDQKITILRGNGFYYKFIPPNLGSPIIGDDDYIFTSLGTSNYVAIFVYFLRFKKTGVITGNMNIFTDNLVQFNVTVRKTRHFDNSLKLSAIVSGNTDATRNVTLNSGYVTIPNFPKGQPVQISSQAATGGQQDIYNSQKIQNIFYSQSWLYILFFIFLYLIFIPICAIVDCCQSQLYVRKKVQSQQASDGNKNSQDSTIVKVNYKDFFPMYNTGNTPRPRRLAKVCLFILNMQHIITFLCLIYFNLPANNPVGAIALVIPGYLCTVIMGYICGMVFRLLPGHFKYLINILPLGYWFLWFFLMRIMSQKNSQYRVYVLVFSIICFFIDLIFDSLETLLVYFAISQQEKQIQLFNCLAKWLSYRGFYQFDKLAKQLQNND